MQPIPAFSELGGEGVPTGANWGVFGKDDRLGTVNFIDAGSVRLAAGLVRTGQTFALGLPQNFFDPPLVAERRAARHVIRTSPTGADDKYDDFYPQASSQWDALRHYRHPKYGAYNGILPGAIGDDDDTLSISLLARRGIVARGVLADLARWREQQGRPIDCAVDDAIGVEDVQACLAAQGVTLARGTVLLVRTGWLGYFRQQETSPGAVPRGRDLKSPGLSNDPSMAAYLWDQQVAAVAADNPAVEAAPGPGGRALHVQLLTFLGMPLGELWDLDALAAACAADGVYEFMLASAPTDLPGGCGSPANALAIR